LAAVSETFSSAVPSSLIVGEKKILSLSTSHTFRPDRLKIQSEESHSLIISTPTAQTLSDEYYSLAGSSEKILLNQNIFVFQSLAPCLSWEQIL
jgi:hypothetical protein